MAYRDLREFTAVLEKKGMLKRVSATVDPVLEITEITDRVSKMNGPALLFEKPKGSSYAVLINASVVLKGWPWLWVLMSLMKLGHGFQNSWSFRICQEVSWTN